MALVDRPRTKLRKFLEKQLALIENSEVPQSGGLETLLRQAVEGLLALNYGESQPLFALNGKNGAKDGTKPYTLRKLRMKALGFADLLIAKKYKGEDAASIRTVADAHGEKAATFRKWRTRLGKTTDSLMISFREEISRNRDWDNARVMEELEKAGETYKRERKLAHKLKK
jgi:hypothetical protein